MKEEKQNRAPLRHRKKDKGAGREILEWFFTLASAILIALLVHTYIGQGYTVLGPSMQPTLYTGEKVVIGKLTYRLAEPQLGDIVVVKYPKSASNPEGDNSYVKRVVGLSGDTLEVREGQLIRNGQVVDEPYIKEPMQWDYGAVTVPDGMVFVMGDNRNDSNDSRSSSVGPIPRDNVVGKAYCIYWPLNRISSVYSPDDQ